MRLSDHSYCVARLAVVTAGLFVGAQARAGLPLGQTPPPITLKDDAGGLVQDDGPWSSDMLKGKVWAFFYVDPDERDLNPALEAALQKEDFPNDKFGSVSVINMAATSLPNFAINISLRSKQEAHPRTIFVRDLDKLLVKQWKLKDDAFEVAIFNKQGKVVFSKDGLFAKSDIDAMVAAIRKSIDAPAH